MKYVLAVSGGVDSVALLDLVARDTKFRNANFNETRFPDDFIVAHFDHGIRGAESAADAAFVEELARQYNVKFVKETAKLGKGASEESAREARYKFLGSVCQKNQAQLVTAHHQNDLAETILMNLIRGTGWRGLAPMSGLVNGHAIVRPLLGLTKSQIINYALEHNLRWHEDSTNASLRYFRNRVRLVLQSAKPADLSRLYKLYTDQVKLRKQIDEELVRIAELSTHTTSPMTLSLYYLIMLPDNVAIELLKHLTKSMLLKDQLWQLLLFIKTGASHKSLRYKSVSAELSVREVVLTTGF